MMNIIKFYIYRKSKIYGITKMESSNNDKKPFEKQQRFVVRR